LGEFTVLIEGGSGPEPHPIFIGFLCEAAVGGGDGTLEGQREDAAWAS
jgi:hypothetical protein